MEEQLHLLHLVLHHLQKLHETAIPGPRKMSTEAIATTMTCWLPHTAGRGRFGGSMWIAAMEILCVVLQQDVHFRREVVPAPPQTLRTHLVKS